MVVAAPFPIFYVVSGIWGTAEIEGFVSYLPPIGSSTDYPRTLAVPYTPVTAISGQVTDAYGLNLALGTTTVVLSTPDLGVFCSTTTTPRWHLHLSAGLSARRYSDRCGHPYR